MDVFDELKKTLEMRADPHNVKIGDKYRYKGNVWHNLKGKEMKVTRKCMDEWRLESLDGEVWHRRAIDLQDSFVWEPLEYTKEELATQEAEDMNLEELGLKMAKPLTQQEKRDILIKIANWKTEGR